jgi:hypothetical protein
VTSWRLAPIPGDQVDLLIAIASRAPSVQNTQPWRFRVRQRWIELHADPGRRLRVDPLGRELLISCGAALFGLRLGVRSLGFVPVVEALPDRSRPGLLARVGLGATEPLTDAERTLLEALPHRHTHRGAFAGGPLPRGLLTDLARDAVAEGATLALVDRIRGYERLADIVSWASQQQDGDSTARADMRDWTRGPDAAERDGVPPGSFAAGADQHRGRLRQRDFDLGRGLGMLDTDGRPPAVTAVLLTPGNSQGDWLCAGQALHRVLAHAASSWVFASLYSQPLEVAGVGEMIAERLNLAGVPQMILQLGRAHSTRVTPRRPPADLIDP